MTNRVVIVGSVAKDSIETPFGRVANTVGGSCVYSSIAASFFAPAAVIGVVGEDFPKAFLKKMSARGIDVKGIKIAEGKTFFWRGKYSSDLNTAETLETQLNVFGNFSPEIPAEYLPEKYLFLANIDPELQIKVLEKMKTSGKCRFAAGDTMNFWIGGKKKKLEKLFSHLEALLINEAEIRQFTGEHNIIKAVKRILALGVKVVVVKKGEYGAACFMKNRMFFLPAYPLRNAVDPTGAGDSFAGAFMGFLAGNGETNWDNIKKAAVYGAVVSSFTVSGFGVSRLMTLTKKELAKRYADFVNLIRI
ncbi:MAG: sugar kinase [Elusimicrobia bacterium CG08_land_8_20_14_0_20_44_26]|nr:MAG: sugar kinase [Elusimicrobia bacterium CG08_land_8_20_14_0_20_44_26]